MVGLAALVLTEKLWRWGPGAGRLAGAAALALAVATTGSPGWPRACTPRRRYDGLTRFATSNEPGAALGPAGLCRHRAAWPSRAPKPRIETQLRRLASLGVTEF